MDLTPIAPRTRSLKSVMAKAEFLVNVRIWPLRSELSPDRWLSNFSDSERPTALHLLDQFMYFGEELLDAAFIAGFQRISMSMLDSRNPQRLSVDWDEFLASTLVAPVQGETASVADSGQTFIRKARQVLGLDEDQLHAPMVAAKLALSCGRPLVLVDDFVGTGQQMIRMWENLGLQDLTDCGVPIYYAPAFSTEYGRQAIQKECKGLSLSPGQIISGEYSVVEANSILWPAGRGEECLEVVRKASMRAGIPNTNGKSVDDWQGFHRLGLALAMHGSVPDATLPLFRWEENGWKPLIRKR